MADCLGQILQAVLYSAQVSLVQTLTEFNHAAVKARAAACFHISRSDADLLIYGRCYVYKFKGPGNCPCKRILLTLKFTKVSLGQVGYNQDDCLQVHFATLIATSFTSYHFILPKCQRQQKHFNKLRKHEQKKIKP